MRKSAFPIFHRIHFYVGLLIAPFILVAAFTGMFYALAPTMENVYYHNDLTNNSSGPKQSLEKQIQAAKAVYPNLKLETIRVEADPHKNTRVFFYDPALEKAKDYPYKRVVMVNPITAQVEGNLTQVGSFSALPLRSWIDEGHRRLWIRGDTGRLYSELAASWLGVLAVTGTVLWFLRKNPKFKVTGTSGSRSRSISWHAVVGIYILPALLFLSLTGLTWSKHAGDKIRDLRTHYSWQTPTLNTSTPAAQLGNRPLRLSMGDQAQLVLNQGLKNDLAYPLDISTPKNDNHVWTIEEARKPFRMSLDSIAVDTANNTVVDRLPFSSYPLASQLTEWGVQLHAGTMFGITNQIVLFLVAVGIIFMIIKGYHIWWKTKPDLKNFPPPVRRGAWKRTPFWLLALIGVVTVVLAYWAPLFLVSLIIFAVADGLLFLGSKFRKNKTPKPN